MNTKKLKQSIAVIVILIGLIITIHIADFLVKTPTELLIVANVLGTTTNIFNIIYFLQLQKNFSSILFISNIKYPTYIVVAMYIITSLSFLSMFIFRVLFPDDFLLLDRIVSSSLIIILAALIITLVHYCILGYRLQKNTSFPLIRLLGWLYLFLKPTGEVIYFILVRFPAPVVKIYSHFFILGEIVPLLIVYRIYQQLLTQQKNKEEVYFLTNSETLPGEEK